MCSRRTRSDRFGNNIMACVLLYVLCGGSFLQRQRIYRMEIGRSGDDAPDPPGSFRSDLLRTPRLVFITS
jgi:hypothetical protein